MTTVNRKNTLNLNAIFGNSDVASSTKVQGRVQWKGAQSPHPPLKTDLPLVSLLTKLKSDAPLDRPLESNTALALVPLVWRRMRHALRPDKVR